MVKFNFDDFSNPDLVKALAHCSPLSGQPSLEGKHSSVAPTPHQLTLKGCPGLSGCPVAGPVRPDVAVTFATCVMAVTAVAPELEDTHTRTTQTQGAVSCSIGPPPVKRRCRRTTQPAVRA